MSSAPPIAEEHRVAGHGGRGAQISEVFTSRAAAIEEAKGHLLLGRGIAVEFPDGDVGIYDCRLDARRDTTGEHALYAVQRL